MGDQDTSGIDSCSSDSHDTSVSDGEILKYSSMRTKSDHQTTTDLGKEDQGPKFDFNSWNVEGPPGIQFLSLLPLHQGYEFIPCQYPQSALVTKLKPSQVHRKTRRREFASGRTIQRDILEERKLRQAANSDDFMTVLRLLDNGVDSRCMDEKKRTPLHFAASRGNSQIVSLLLDRGAEPNQKDAIGNTPLHLAACTNHIEVVTLLLKAGTDIHALDNSGRSPLHLAQSRFRILQRDPKFTEETATGFKEKITQVTDMMQAYLKVSNKSDNVDVEQLNGLCEKLQLSSTKAEVDLVNEMLADFTQLTIQKKKPG
ncbi:unnamed protein product [Owenia fusiformis]|uniref:Ankyrin repeat domain-containing protein 54 n=1 Tax=Owenia fusiformis TaxID=6347 RepID=A0A8S4PQR9_OWEFU|nr:unnamed protein product [Owenia fusiformis]